MTKAGFEADPWPDRNLERKDKRADCKDTWFDPGQLKWTNVERLLVQETAESNISFAKYFLVLLNEVIGGLYARLDHSRSGDS